MSKQHSSLSLSLSFLQKLFRVFENLFVVQRAATLLVSNFHSLASAFMKEFNEPIWLELSLSSSVVVVVVVGVVDDGVVVVVVCDASDNN